MVSAKDFLSFAETLALPSEQRSEIHLRMAAARSYYAVLHLISEHLAIQHEKSAGYGSHQLIHDSLMSIPPAECPEFIRLAKCFFQSLKATRVRADYKISESFDEQEARTAIAHAKMIIGKYLH